MMNSEDDEEKEDEVVMFIKISWQAELCKGCLRCPCKLTWRGTEYNINAVPTSRIQYQYQQGSTTLTYSRIQYQYSRQMYQRRIVTFILG